jgi:tetratricopeptide (TPR) repeat protein
LLSSGEYQQARRALEESFGLKSGHEDAWSVSTTLGNLGLTLRLCGEFDAALDCHTRALNMFKSIGDTWGELGELNFMADVHRDRHEYAQAARLYASSLDANAERIRSAVSDSLNGLGSIAASRGQYRRVAVLAGAVESIRSETGGSDPIVDGPLPQSTTASARASLGSALFEEARAEGGALSVAEAIEVGRMIARDLSA